MESFYYNAEIEHIAEILKNRIYFGVLPGTTAKILRSTAETIYFSVDEELLYINYYFDFGPLNLSCLHKYCCKVNKYLCAHGVKRIVHYTTSDPNKRSNAAYLIGSFAVIYLKMDPRDVYKILLSAGGAYKNFVDASQGISQYTIRLSDCLQAIVKAVSFNFFNFNDFNADEYDTYDKLQNGDMNWLLPRKFLAFIGPTETEFLNGHPPSFYLNYFLRKDVKTVIRLNNKTYDASVFTQAGIEHYDLFFPDGTTPPKDILLKFLNIVETAPAAIGVHCKAGLGRTGSLIGAYIIKHYRMTAKEAIAWMRICRPGSVIGQQQGWLEKIESWLWRQGSQYRLKHYGEGDKIPRHRFGIYSIEWPRERERLLKLTQRKRYAEACRAVTSKFSQSSAPNQTVSKQQQIFSGNNPPENSSYMRHHYFEKPKPCTVQKKDDDFKKITKILSKVHNLNCNANQNSCANSDVTVLTAAKTKDAADLVNVQENTVARRKRSKSVINAASNTGNICSYHKQSTRSHSLGVQSRCFQTAKQVPHETCNSPTQSNISGINYTSQTQTASLQEKSSSLSNKKHTYTVLEAQTLPVLKNKKQVNAVFNGGKFCTEHFKECKPRKPTKLVEHQSMTQGDRLNEIKVKRRLKSAENYDYVNEMRNKKHLLENSSLKRSNLEGMYTRIR